MGRAAKLRQERRVLRGTYFGKKNNSDKLDAPVEFGIRLMMEGLEITAGERLIEEESDLDKLEKIDPDELEAMKLTIQEEKIAQGESWSVSTSQTIQIFNSYYQARQMFPELTPDVLSTYL